MISWTSCVVCLTSSFRRSVSITILHRIIWHDLISRQGTTIRACPFLYSNFQMLTKPAEDVKVFYKQQKIRGAKTLTDFLSVISNRIQNFFGCGWSNDLLVPETGLEPARLATYAPKAYVYTNFTTRAWVYYNTDFSKKIKFIPPLSIVAQKCMFVNSNYAYFWQEWVFMSIFLW